MEGLHIPLAAMYRKYRVEWKRALLAWLLGNQGDRTLPVGLAHTQMLFNTSVNGLGIELGWYSEDQSRLEEQAVPANISQRTAIAFTYSPDVMLPLAKLLGTSTLSTRYQSVNQDNRFDVHRSLSPQAMISDWDNDSTMLELGLDPNQWLSLNMGVQWHQQVQSTAVPDRCHSGLKSVYL
ncbi:MAG: hypothetical protein WCY88_17345 [Spongiibacteraceae bacterium]